MLVFWETTHTFDRTPHRKDNSSVAGDWLIDQVPCEVFFWEGWGVSALSPRYPWPVRRYCQVPQNYIETAMAVSDSTTSWRAESFSTVPYTNTLVRLLKRSSHNEQKTEKEDVFNVQSGQNNAREECTVETHQASLPFWYENWASGLICNPTFIPNNNNNEIWETLKRMRQF